jgi:uncharacterized membrane protein (DUF485 family)
MPDRSRTRFWSIVAVTLLVLIVLVVSFATGYVNWPIWQNAG